MGEDVREIIIATTNRGKLAELRKPLEGCGVRVRGLEEFGEVAAAIEDGVTFGENARKKARHYSRLLDSWVLADDSGLEVEALNGAPGVLSARFAQVGSVDRAEQDRANNEKLLRLLQAIPPEKRSARFCCCLCLSSPQEILLEVDGCLEGVIVDTPRGDNGFGYDPIFYLTERNKTLAQLPMEEKNAISHRGRALKNLVEQLKRL